MDLKSILKKNFGDSYYVGAYPKLDRISTRVIGLDLALGGGLPLGRIGMIYGGSSACKTTTTLHIAKAFQEEGKEVCFVDAEATLEEERLDELGINKDNFHLYQPSNGEDALNFAIVAANSGAGLVVIDSVPFLVTKQSQEKEVGGITMAPQARLLAAEQSKIVSAARDSGCAFLFLNQSRSNIGGYGPNFTIPGGSALKYMCSYIIELARAEVYKDGSGLRIRAKLTKNKTSPEGKVTEFSVLFPGAHINKYSSMREAAEAAGFLVRRGSFYRFSDEYGAEVGLTTNIGQGAKSAEDWFAANPDYYAALYDTLIAKAGKQDDGLLVEDTQEE